MRNPHWAKATEHAAVPERVRRCSSALAKTSAGPLLQKAGAEQCRVLAALFSGSQVLSELLCAKPAWVADLLDLEDLRHARRLEGIRREARDWLGPLLDAQDYGAAFGRLREFKQRHLLRIAARDLARLAEVQVVTRELSDLADLCLSTVTEICHRQLVARFGQPHHLPPEGDWQPTQYCVLGLGKLGGQELNYSSDVDVIFVYEEEGAAFKTAPTKGVQPAKGISNHQFFIRLAEALIAEVTRQTPEGQLYRIDFRLRPEGKSGPLARSLESYENFYAQWGQTWERMMLIKARCVAGSAGLAHEFAETIQPFRYPRVLGERFLEEIAAMKRRIEEEVVRSGEAERNVKLGQGGIRDIEFVVQTRQLLNGGRNPFLQNSQTLPTLKVLVKYNLLPQGEASDLAAAYGFLRDVEHRLQMENNLQTHTIPKDAAAKSRLAALMGFAKLPAFEKQLRNHTRRVREIYDRWLAVEKSADESMLPSRFEGCEEEWVGLAVQHGFRDPQKAVRLLVQFICGPGFVHVSARTENLARELVARLLAICPRKEAAGRVRNLAANTLSDPDRVLARLDSFVAAYGTRSMLYETWARHPSLFELLVLLFDRSEYLAEAAIKTPDLVDDLVLSGHLRRNKTAGQTLADLRHGLEDADQRHWLRRYYQTEFMRIGLREIVGLVDGERNLSELSALADACLQYALEVVLRKHRLKAAPFVIIGLGKLGGAELTYGSDLDLIFVAGAKPASLPKLQGIAAEIMALLSEKTGDGSVFNTDARLRPDGAKGLLVNTLPAYEDYYRNRAMLWEIQALTRARFVAGNAAVGKQFIELARNLTNFKKPPGRLAAYAPDWKTQIARMRQRIEKERTPAGKEALAFKTAAGGLVGAEFIAQTLCMEHGIFQPNTLAALQTVADRGLLSSPDAQALIDSFRSLRRVEIILRRWSYAGESELPDDPEPFFRVSVRCGFASADEFRQAVAAYRQGIREIYLKVFASDTPPTATDDQTAPAR